VGLLVDTTLATQGSYGDESSSSKLPMVGNKGPENVAAEVMGLKLMLEVADKKKSSPDDPG